MFSHRALILAAAITVASPSVICANALFDAEPVTRKPSISEPSIAEQQDPAWHEQAYTPMTVAVESSLPVNAMRESVKPLYPELARRERIEGYVVVQFDITRSGEVTGAHIIEAQPANYFEAVAIDTVNQYRFTPDDTTRDDIAIRGAVNRFVFSLKESDGRFKPLYTPHRGRTYFAGLATDET